MEIWIVLGVMAVAVIWIISVYNRIIALKQTRNNAFSDIDVQLKLRYDLVPSLVNIVKGYAKHEEKIFTEVTKARATAMSGGAGMKDRSSSEGVLGMAMMNLMAVAENYPDLKADSNFRALQGELSDIENKISAARRFFNNATNEFNTVIQQFPGVFVAKIFSFSGEEFFELDDSESKSVQKAPEVSF